MMNPFLLLYDYFHRHRRAYWSTLIFLIILLGWGASRITLEEDISHFFPNDKRVEKLNYIFKNSKLSEKLVVMVSVRDSATTPVADDLVACASGLMDSIGTGLREHIAGLSGRVDDSQVGDIFTKVQENLPIYVDDRHYAALDSLQNPDVVRRKLGENFRQLVSPVGIVMKKTIVNDPLGISLPVLRDLQQLQYDENFELYDNFIVTRDHRHLVFFIQPNYPANETRRNAVLQRELDKVIETSVEDYPQLHVSYFGASVVAVGNARQLQFDTILTVSIMIVLLLIALLGFFRKKRVPLLILLPVGFGAVFSLALIATFKPTLSILALAVGAVILGVAVDYSLHFLVHLKEEKDTRKVIGQLSKPLTMGSLTTVFAFFSLQFTNASVLQDVGLFAGLSLIGAALFSLIFLPHLISAANLPEHSGQWLRRVSEISLENNRILVYIILLATPVFSYFAYDVTFNSDMNKLNFMDAETRQANERLESINKSTLSSVYVISSFPSLEKALRVNERSSAMIRDLQAEGIVEKSFSVSSFLISDSLQRERLAKWNSYWSEDKIARVRSVLSEEGRKLGFSSAIIQNFDSLIARQRSVISNDSANIFRASFYNDYIIERGGLATVISIVNAKLANRPQVYDSLKHSGSTAFDKQMLTNLFVEFVHADFNYIVTITSLLVFLALLVSYGRIELTLITFVPMFFTWLWILGIMALFRIEFNIVNVMVSTFIFGLGDDYSIFTMDGLQEEYRTGRKALPAIRTSIVLSAFTTICGLGVLIFAKHPALKSIAAISIIGIACVFIMSLILQPFFFRLLISDRTRKGLPPMTFLGICRTAFTYGFFVSGSLLLTIIGIVFKAVPFARKHTRYLFHVLISWFTGALIYLALSLKKRFIGRTPSTFSRASVVIANHSSFLDILLMTMQHPKLILLTNKWVWNSPVFGGVVRLADYYPVMEGAEDSIDRVRSRVKEGYSVVVFPEGTRSEDGKLRRFHKGAFYMAEHLKLPIQPVLIHGANDGIRKGDMYVNASHITMKYLQPIESTDPRFGDTYSERTKNISRYFKSEFLQLRREMETPEYFFHKLKTNYLFKGPVLEWYLKIKVRLEDYYRPFHELVPAKCTILDLGCGYGFLPYMLQLLSEDRIITAVDYDEEKIAVASNGYLRTSRLNFVQADITEFRMANYDVIILSDVLHYLTEEKQDILVRRCFDALNPGGTLIIRDGDADLQQRHQGTKLTELFSVKVLGFNKSTNELNFISGRALTAKATEHGLQVNVLDNASLTSNVIFVVSKPGVLHAAV
jgi:uncharacterized protein